MAAYVIACMDVVDPEGYGAYRAKVMATVTAHGGRFLVRGGDFSVKEGVWPRARLVVLEFPSRAAAEGWYASPEYQAILPLRLKAGRGEVVIVDGVPPA